MVLIKLKTDKEELGMYEYIDVESILEMYDAGPKMTILVLGFPDPDPENNGELYTRSIYEPMELVIEKIRTCKAGLIVPDSVS